MYAPNPDALHGTLYDPRFEHDACGIGFIADIEGRRSHAVLAQAVLAVGNMRHRGATDADAKTGDGVGVLTQLPHAFFARELSARGIEAPPEGCLGVGVFFLPLDLEERRRAQSLVGTVFEADGLPLLGWRDVPIDESALGRRAAATRPHIAQALIGCPDGLGATAFERALYLARKVMEHRAAAFDRLYVASLSARTIVYKGLLVSRELNTFYPDLRDPDYTTALAVYHQRYSTNTFPTWERAQPFRMVCHNGEINTLQGNVSWTRAREADLASPVWGADVERLRPVIDLDGSDSAMLDNVLELLVRSGRDIRHAMLMLVPEAWELISDMDSTRRAFYHYHACLTEPWDGPAALTFTDGRIVGSVLDRNGLRPVRWVLSDDGLLYAGSEVGAIPITTSRIVRKGRLGPGQMIAVDTVERRLWLNDRIKRHFATQQPYQTWLDHNLRRLETTPAGPEVFHNGDLAASLEQASSALRQQQAAFGYTNEELTVVLRPMVENAKEPVGSMGDDTPHAVLSEKPRPLFHYFRQRFAQVTNPPIDPLREELVMSLSTLLGARSNLLAATPEHAHLLELDSPILTDDQAAALRALPDASLPVAEVSALWPVRDGAAALEQTLADLCHAAEAAIDNGTAILIVSDRGVNWACAPVPALLAVGAIHHHLIRAGKRMRVSLVAETGEAREVHHFAALVGYGASAVYPYLALQSVRHIAEHGQLRHSAFDAAEAARCYVKAAEQGLLKIMSKMGIATIDSYCGAQIFEAIGLNRMVIERYFTGTPSRVGGVGLEQIARDLTAWHLEAFGDGSNGHRPRLDSPGFYKFKRKGEHHNFKPQVVRALHAAARYQGALDGEFDGGYAEYCKYSALVHDRPPAALRDLLDFDTSGRQPISVDEVEPVTAIVRRFSTAAMSHGSLGREAHENLAIAMNRLGGRSNSGEGGEAQQRFGTEANSAAKQVASGRFGVTPAYLVNADELQIKMAQGSKPGEGGQLPGHKVSVEIATIRHTTPGVALISPPPHHDIYSIEDLAQLIYDLKQVNPGTEVSVKLVAEAGVGTIAAGVAKGGADVVVISGHAGGTGASPLSSIKNVGIPWELGLAEIQQTLVGNDLRGRVRLRTDGGLQTGRDVVMAAILGADEYSFGTAAVVAEGCLMARACHLNTCPVGIATQREELRAKFPGTPEMVVTFFTFLAQEVRETLARLGYGSLDEVIGRTELLHQIIRGEAAAHLDLAPVLRRPVVDGAAQPGCRRAMQGQNGLYGIGRLNQQLVADVWPSGQHPSAAGAGEPIVRSYPISNTDRTVGATLAGAIARSHGDQGLACSTVRLVFEGSAGQSFGAFNIRGMHLTLFGDANDYVGKGMGGGEIVVRPPADSTFEWASNVIMGNTVLYGATGGRLFAAGRAGERFAVRNSGAQAVVEGVGDHCCEYMTGGAVTILGPTGRNFGAGMTGGIAFVLDAEREFHRHYNPQLIRLDPVERLEDVAVLRQLIADHFARTESAKARAILDDWDAYLPLFWRAMPKEAVAQIENANEATEETR
jgi:glutamate synthase (ferredoxin)